TYLAILLASFFIGPGTAAPDRRLAWGAMLVLAGAATASAVWFLFVQTWIIGAFCPYCIATHFIGLLLAALIIWRAKQSEPNAATTPEDSQVANPRLPGTLPAVRLALIGVALAGILAA